MGSANADPDFMAGFYGFPGQAGLSRFAKIW